MKMNYLTPEMEVLSLQGVQETMQVPSPNAAATGADFSNVTNMSSDQFDSIF